MVSNQGYSKRSYIPSWTNKDSTSIQDTSDILNIDDIPSCVTPQKQKISVQDTSTPPCLTPLITNLPLAPIELTKTTELPPVGE